MFSLATIKAIQIYGIAIAVSMFVAVLIKLLVLVTSRVKPAVAPQKPIEMATAVIPDEVIAAISAALAVFNGPHRILHIGESKRSWANEGRIAQHSHQPRH
ncbi:hypothetical protein [Propionivibrio sp.]|uniref:hypothetical protein n=1 Tax=Propionivibrio sp. TaxID=2212460 RepID=UPI00260545B3|nr:hypothetical protein [Propionivibrio sp.]